jgi:hypothetical protein
VGVFYYVWYGAPETDGAYMHWNHSVLPHWNAQVQAKHAGIFLSKKIIWMSRVHQAAMWLTSPRMTSTQR